MKKVLGVKGAFKASNMEDLAFGGIKIHVPYLFPFFQYTTAALALLLHLIDVVLYINTPRDVL